MLKRKPIILSMLVVASLSCLLTAQISNASEPVRPAFPFDDCIELENTAQTRLSIGVWRHPRTLCAHVVYSYDNLTCEGDGSEVKAETVPVKVTFNGKATVHTLRRAFSGSGNQPCPEAIIEYSSPYCYQYTSGGNTYYIPPG